jgi:hypothetical protein
MAATTRLSMTGILSFSGIFIMCSLSVSVSLETKGLAFVRQAPASWVPAIFDDGRNGKTEGDAHAVSIRIAWLNGTSDQVEWAQKARSEKERANLQGGSLIYSEAA